MTKLQIAPETIYTDIEHDFIENEPPGLFPGAQDSVWGEVRSTYAAYLQVLADMMTKWYGNLDPATVTTDDLPEWEYMLNLPQSNTALTDQARRNNIIARFGIGPFTRARRRAIIESFISATFGQEITFDPTGVPLTSGGVPFAAGTQPVTTLYRVYENIPNFSYEVWINSSVTPDIPGLTRELQRITPAGMTLTIDNSHANILDYFRTVRSMNPLGYWRLGNLLDSTRLGNNGTASGGVTAGTVAAPGLLAAGIGGADGATSFNGASQLISIPGTAQYNALNELTLTAWVQPTAIPTAGNYAGFLASSSYTTYLSLYAGGNFLFSAWINGSVQNAVWGDSSLVAGTKYMITGTYDGLTMKLYKNKTLISQYNYTGSIQLGAPLYLGGAGFGYLNGIMDEAAVFDRALSPDEITLLYNTGVNIP